MSKEILNKFKYGYGITVHWSNIKPRYWYSINQKSGVKEIRIFCLELHETETKKCKMIELIIGPLRIVFGWLIKNTEKT